MCSPVACCLRALVRATQFASIQRIAFIIVHWGPEVHEQLRWKVGRMATKVLPFSSVLTCVKPDLRGLRYGCWRVSADAVASAYRLAFSDPCSQEETMPFHGLRKQECPLARYQSQMRRGVSRLWGDPSLWIAAKAGTPAFLAHAAGYEAATTEVPEPGCCHHAETGVRALMSILTWCTASYTVLARHVYCQYCWHGRFRSIFGHSEAATWLLA
jgi:hypothetical protein